MRFSVAGLDLPVENYPLQRIPDITKMNAPGYGVWLVTTIYDSFRLRLFKPGGLIYR